MAPIKSPKSNSSSSSHGEGVARRADILASCYLVESATASLKGLHYCTTGLAGAECASNNVGRAAAGTTAHADSAWHRRRGGAALRIREECERFFCETLRAMFLGERNAALHGSGLASVYNNNNNHNNNSSNGRIGLTSAVRRNEQLTPPDDYPITGDTVMAYRSEMGRGTVLGWLEIWDYAGGSSFRGFVADDSSRGTKSMFVFFDAHSITRDLRQAVVALIELAESALGCTHMVICIERSMPEEESKALIKGLQWANFSLTTLDFWSSGFDLVSSRWLFMGMEV
ncbi:4941fb3c-8cb1-4cb4-b2de-a474e312d291 [Thermothielavioides terrestris]|uniref:Ornithine decarboxylase antizyme n=1 Tax=Thermothielavioides terrestris TaxID=2587410 RepID=A0A446BE51_9PEZI|nr:4941fb3c-8cb1-4cb4-b2de-a474e312d291 [Thermothielavioides terrestris]